MHLAARHIRQLGLLLTLTGICTTVVLLLFVRVNNSTLQDSPKAIGFRYKTAEHNPEGARSDLHGTVHTEVRTNNTALEDNVTFGAKQTIIQQQRLRRVQEGCTAMSKSSRRGPATGQLPKEALKNVIVDDKYHLLYCHIPKIASTSWIRIFLVLNGVLKSARDGKQAFVHREAMESVRLLSSYDEQQIRTMLGTYTKFLFVRNPFTRILSAFRNKLELSASHRGIRSWHGWINRIKARCRNASSTAEFGPTARTGDLTFAEFVSYIGDQRTTETNKHWNSMVHRCRPCHINYTFIGRLETIRTDSKRLLQLTKIDKLVSFPGADGSSPTNSSTSKIIASYFADVPAKDIERLRQKFKWDFKLFGYDSLHEQPDKL